jgi:methylmalonyl-CoA/ethylmalonyl-CoA epimerase
MPRGGTVDDDVPVSTADVAPDQAGAMASIPADPPRIDGAVLDHVAHAVPRWHEVWDRYATDLGAVWASGGPGPGFAPGQLRFANGSRVEVLMPWDVEVNDFLARFLAHSGPGAHHLTFKLPDIGAALDQARRFGIEPVGVDLSDPEWMEAFLHPKLAHGIVVQLAEAPHAWSSPPPADYPVDVRMRADGSGPTAPATLERVCLVVADFDGARGLFCGLLGGAVVDEGSDGDVAWVDVRWPGPLGLRLVGTDGLGDAGSGSGGTVAEWLDGRPGRVHHIAIETEEPGAVPGARPAEHGVATLGMVDGPDGPWVVPAEENCGLQIVLSGFGGASGSPATGR